MEILHKCKNRSLKHGIFILAFIGLGIQSIEALAAPFYQPNYAFPTEKQGLNACYFTSINIALQAKYKTALRLPKTLKMIGFDGSSLATWEFKKKFSDLTHIAIKEYSTKADLIRLLDRGETVLVSTTITVGNHKNIRHVSVAYSYDDAGIWVSDPLGGKRKRIEWESVFTNKGKVRYNALRTISVKDYQSWSKQSIEREIKEDIWVNENMLRR